MDLSKTNTNPRYKRVAFRDPEGLYKNKLIEIAKDEATKTGIKPSDSEIIKELIDQRFSRIAS